MKEFKVCVWSNEKPMRTDRNYRLEQLDERNIHRRMGTKHAMHVLTEPNKRLTLTSIKHSGIQFRTEGDSEFKRFYCVVGVVVSVVHLSQRVHEFGKIRTIGQRRIRSTNAPFVRAIF